jgi:predicted PurR-regulated permease PerM
MAMPDIDRQRLNTLLFYAAIILVGYMAYCIVKPFLLPFAWAGIFALCTYPVYNWFTRRMKPKTAAALVTLLVALVLIVPAVTFAMMLVGQAGEAMSGVQEALESARNNPTLQEKWAWLQTHVQVPSIDEMKGRLTAQAGDVARTVASRTGAILQNVATFVFMLLVTLVSLFFFLKDSAAIGRAVRSLLPFEEARKAKLIAQARELIYASVVTMLSVAATQGFLGGIIFALLGIKAPVFWGLAMSICAFIPLVGTTIIWAPAAIWLLVQGSWIKGLLLAVGGVFIISGIDNVLRPLIMSGRTSMNILLMLVSILGGLLTFGFVGVVLGPVVMATCVSLLSLDVEEGAGSK